jgi:quercetin dioxygenase-like cupin family protein
MLPFQHLDWNSIAPEALTAQIQRQYVSTEGMTIARFVLKKGAVVPTHQHPNEQIAFILEGALKFVVKGREVIVRAGEVLCIPADTPHSAEALENTVDVDVFTPPRTDWIAKDDAYLR